MLERRERTGSSLPGPGARPALLSRVTPRGWGRGDRLLVTAGGGGRGNGGGGVPSPGWLPASTAHLSEPEVT